MVAIASTEKSSSEVRRDYREKAARAGSVQLREVRVADLEAVNLLIRRAIDTWDLPDRVKRVSAPLYQYDELDLNFQQLMLAQGDDGAIVGVAAWEPADLLDTPAQEPAMLLHGIYVTPGLHRQGIGARLLKAAEEAVRADSFDALLVKVQAGAELFFVACGFSKLPVTDPRRDYPHRYWKRVRLETSL